MTEKCFWREISIKELKQAVEIEGKSIFEIIQEYRHTQGIFSVGCVTCNGDNRKCQYFLDAYEYRKAEEAVG